MTRAPVRVYLLTSRFDKTLDHYITSGKHTSHFSSVKDITVYYLFAHRTPTASSTRDD